MNPNHQSTLTQPPEANPSANMLNESEGYPLSFAQQRLWFMDNLEPGSPLYNVPTVLRIKGGLEIEPLRKALNIIVERHEVLRTTMTVRDGQALQKINPPAPVPFRYLDLTEIPSEQRESAARQRVLEEVRRSFNLSADLMIRATLLQLNSNEYILALVTHHIASDGWSLRVLFNEWATAYQAILSGKEPILPDLPIQYADFAQWQHEWIHTEKYHQQLEYWRKQLKPPTPVLQLPTDRPRPFTQTFRGALYVGMLPPELVERAKQLFREERTTIFIGLLAVFKVLLYRYTQQDDLIVACPIAGRNRMETEGLIGFFVNTLAIRSVLNRESSFKEVLAQVRERTLGAYANQEVPFDKLVEELHPERSATHMPFAQVMFSVQSDNLDPAVFPGMEVEELEVDSGTAKFDLTVVAKETPSGLQVLFEYNSDLFDQERITRMMEHFRTLLESICRAPADPIGKLDLLPEEERKLLLQDWNHTSRPYARSECIHQVFEAQVAKTPDVVAVQYGTELLTYRELNARANQLAHRLQKMKVGAGTLVGVYMERSVEMIVAFLGILKAGGAYVPLDLSYPRERLAFMVQDTQMPVVITHSRLAGDLPEATTIQLPLDSEWPTISQEPRQLPPNQVHSGSMAYVIYTSGSTGVPKGVVVPHRAVTRLVLNTDYAQITPADRVAQASNASFDAATFEIWGALLNGARLVGVHKEVALSPSDFGEALRNERITTLFLTTALFNQLAREVPGVFASLTHVLFGGEAVDPKWVRAVIQCHPPQRLLHVYGPTENTTFSTWYLVREVDEEAVTVPIGKPIANSQLYILDRSMNPVPIGIPGEIYVGGDGIAQGYWNRPDLTTERFVKNPFAPGELLYKTGDLGRFDSSGNVEFIGRADHQVKLRGFRIELGEIESLLAPHPQVANVVVMIREDLAGDRRLVAYIIPKGEAPTVQELKAYLRAKLPDYMIPSAFVFMESFPLTPNEKVDRRALPAPDQNRPDMNRSFIAPRGSVEEQLAKIWERHLGVQPIGVADNFFELGGHSLLAVRVFSEIETVFNKKLPLATLFRAPTVEEIAAILQENNQAKSWSTIVDIQPKGHRTPFFWIHSLGGDGGGGFFYYRKLAELLGPDQPSFGIRSPQEPFKRIEEMAAFYVQEIRKFQPEGPYHLGGFCFGGNVAFEMAQQLTAAGEEIGLLVMLETSPPNVSHRQSWSATAAKYSIENWMENVKDFVAQSPHEQLSKLKNKSKRLTKKFKSKFAPGLDTPERPAALKEVLDLSTYPKDYVKYAETHWEALTHYQPKPYPGVITLFRAKKQALSHFNHTLGWDALADDRVQVTVIPGTHESMLQEPNVQIVAAKLRALLEEVQTQRKQMEERELAFS